MSKSILILGHTRGLGHFLLKNLPDQNYSVEGLSRVTGHDLSIKDHRKKVIDQSMNFDVVIINARAGFYQTELLLELHSFWKEKKKAAHIITIGSKASVNYLTRTDEILLYDYQKVSLEKAAETLSLDKEIKVTHINFDYLETDSILKREELKETPKIPLSSAQKVIVDAIQMSSDSLVARIDLWARG